VRNNSPLFGAVFFWKTIICQDRLRTTLRKAEQKWAFLCRIVTPDNSSYLGLGKNLLFTEFTSADDWHYEAPNFHSFFDLDADPFQVRFFAWALRSSLLLLRPPLLPLTL
jgi:hypothetical protein